MVDALIEKAGFPPGTVLQPGSPDWKYVTQAGLVEVDIQCDRYLAALFSFDREQRAGRQVLTAAGAGTAAIMGLTGAAGVSIALVAAAFGLAANVFDAGVNSVLYTVSPTAVRAVAARGRQAYIAGIQWNEVKSRPVMMSVVQGYLSQCTPGTIQSNIENAATGAPSVSSSNTDIALKSAALASPASSVVQDPAVWMTTQVAPPSSHRGTVEPSNLPGHVAPEEQGYILTKQDVMAVQTALGVAADGDMGPAGVTPRGPTRQAIFEFRAGRQRGGKGVQPSSDLLDQPTFELLRKAGPMPADANTAFARGMLFDRATAKVPDPKGIGRAIEKLSGSPPVSDSFEELRAAIKVARDKHPTLGGTPGTLDLALFDAP
jgi:hypothetical protein